MSQDSIVIFRNIIEALAVLPAETYKKVSQMVYAYAFDGEKPTDETDHITLALFLSLKPQIDFNVKRYESYVERGKKGGAPKGNSNAKKDKGNEEKQPKTTKNKVKQAETSKNNLQQLEEDTEQDETSKNDLISISVSNNTDVVDVVDVDNAHTRETKEQDGSEEEQQEEEAETEDYNAFLTEFFKETNRSNIEVICMQLHTTPEALRKEAEEVVAEWRLTKARHQDYSDKARHLVNQLRVKYNVKQKEDGRKQKQQTTGTAAAKGEYSGVCETPKKKKHLRSTI